MRCVSFSILLLFTSLVSGTLSAQTSHGCFAGQDASGQPAWMALTAERYGDYYEVYGQVSTTGFGEFRIKADGWSGAGRMFRRHEGEADAVYIKITDYTGSSLVLHVEGYGSFPFTVTPC